MHQQTMACVGDKPLAAFGFQHIHCVRGTHPGAEPATLAREVIDRVDQPPTVASGHANGAKAAVFHALAASAAAFGFDVRLFAGYERFPAPALWAQH